MSYQSPIDIIYGEFRTRVENDILTAVQSVSVNVDKDELLKAIQYDRNQYAKGYYDRDCEIVRCKDCMHYKDGTGACDLSHVHGFPETWFCGDGERR